MNPILQRACNRIIAVSLLLDITPTVWPLVRLSIIEKHGEGYYQNLIATLQKIETADDIALIAGEIDTLYTAAFQDTEGITHHADD